MTTGDQRFEGLTTLEARLPHATVEELRALVSLFDVDPLRTQFATVLAAARRELERRR